MGVYQSHKRRLELIDELDVLDYLLQSWDDWDILNICCSNCGANRWSKGKVGKGNTIVKCDLCPIEQLVQ